MAVMVSTAVRRFQNPVKRNKQRAGKKHAGMPPYTSIGKMCSSYRVYILLVFLFAVYTIQMNNFSYRISHMQRNTKYAYKVHSV